MDFLSGKDLNKDISDQELLTWLREASLELSKIKIGSTLGQLELDNYSNVFTQLLKYTNKCDEEVQVLLNCCFTEMLRIVAPNEIISKSQLKAVFESICKSISLLKDPEKPVYHQIVHVLHMTEFSSIAALAISKGLDSTIIKFIESILESVAINCCVSTEDIIESNLRIIFEEMPEINENFLYPILISLRKEHKKTPRLRICEKILSKKISLLRNPVSLLFKNLFIQGKTSKNTNSSVFNDRFYLAIKLYKINYEYLINLFGVLPEIMIVKKNEKQVIIMISRIAACKKSTLDVTNSHLFNELLKYFDNENEMIRLEMLKFSQNCIKNHISKSNSCASLVSSVNIRLKDTCEKVRSFAVKSLSIISKHLTLSSQSIKEISDRIKDVKKPVRQSSIKALVQLYNSGCIIKRNQNQDHPTYFGQIIDRVMRFIQNFGDTEDQCVAVFNLQKLIIDKPNYELQAKTLLAVFKDLSVEGQQVLESLLQSNKFWASKLLALVATQDQGEFLNSLELFCGNIKSSVLAKTFKTKLQTNHGELFEMLKLDEVRALVKEILECPDFNEMVGLVNQLENLCKDQPKGFVVLRARCFNLIITPDHVQYLINEIDLLPMIARVNHLYLSPFLGQIIDHLKQGKARSQIFEIFSEFNLAKFELQDLVSIEILEILKNHRLEEAKSASCNLKNLEIEFISSLANEILSSRLENDEKILIELLFLKKIVKFWPTVTENLKQEIKNFAVWVCESNEVSCESKCLAIILLHSLVKYCGVFRQVIFVYIRKIGFNLSEFYKKRVKVQVNLSQSDEKKLRLRCFKSLLDLLNISEIKGLLDPKTLSCFAFATLNPDYTSDMSSLIRNNLFKKSNILPPLLAVLALLLGTIESKLAKDALTQVLAKMKSNSLEKGDPEQAARIQPESYTPYVLYILSKCRIPEKSFKLILPAYVKCFAQCEKLDVRYIIHLLKQLKKYQVEGKNINCDLWTLPQKTLELDKICDEMTSIIVGFNLAENFHEGSCRILIPSSYFVRKEDIASPDSVRVSRLDSSVRKRGKESSVKKVFNMFI